MSFPNFEDLGEVIPIEEDDLDDEIDDDIDYNLDDLSFNDSY